MRPRRVCRSTPTRPNPRRSSGVQAPRFGLTYSSTSARQLLANANGASTLRPHSPSGPRCVLAPFPLELTPFRCASRAGFFVLINPSLTIQAQVLLRRPVGAFHGFVGLLLPDGLNFRARADPPPSPFSWQEAHKEK